MSDSSIHSVSGRGLVLRGADMDTDRIIPARFLKTVTFDGLERGVFADDRESLRAAGARHSFDRPEFAGARILLVHKNFGCGSSREHAPQALYRWGIRAIVGESFAEIFFTNSVMLGLPCVTVKESALQTLMTAVDLDPTTELLVDLVHDFVRVGEQVLPATLPLHAKDAFVSGHWDGAGLLLERYEEVEAAVARLPY